MTQRDRLVLIHQLDPMLLAVPVVLGIQPHLCSQMLLDFQILLVVQNYLAVRLDQLAQGDRENLTDHLHPTAQRDREVQGVRVVPMVLEDLSDRVDQLNQTVQAVQMVQDNQLHQAVQMVQDYLLFLMVQEIQMVQVVLLVQVVQSHQLVQVDLQILKDLRGLKVLECLNYQKVLGTLLDLLGQMVQVDLHSQMLQIHLLVLENQDFL